MRNDSLSKTLLVAAAVCVVCSLIVSTAAVVLKPLQEANRLNDRRRNILVAAGLLEPDRKTPPGTIANLFKQIDARMVDLDTGEFVEDVSPHDFDEKAARKTPGHYVELSGPEDTAGIRRRAKRRVVYLLRKHGRIERIILPVRGRGLWSTMYGFLALDGDCNTVEAMEFYAHGETPGLGAEIENARWKAQWMGKKIYDDSGQVELRVVKGQVDSSSPEAVFEVDGLSGATITSRGVTNLIHFWLGREGYGPLLARLRTETTSRNEKSDGPSLGSPNTKDQTPTSKHG